MTTSQQNKDFFREILDADCSRELFESQLIHLFEPEKTEYLNFVQLQFDQTGVENLVGIANYLNPGHFSEILEEDGHEHSGYTLSDANARWLWQKENDLEYIENDVRALLNKDDCFNNPINSKRLTAKQKVLILHLLDKYKIINLMSIHQDASNQDRIFAPLLGERTGQIFYRALASIQNNAIDNIDFLTTENLDAINEVFKSGNLLHICNEIKELRKKTTSKNKK